MKRYNLKPPGTVEKFNELLKQDIENLKLATSDLEEICCPVCDSRLTSTYGLKHGFTLKTCLECEMVYVSPRPNQGALLKFYRDSKASSYFQEFIIKPTEQYRVENIVKPRLDYLSQKILVKGSWLDIGCSAGTLLSEGKKLGWDVHGIEFESSAGRLAKDKGIVVYDEPIETLGLDNKFDLITMFEVLEHVGSPIDVLRACLRANKNNGALVITVPNIGGVEFEVLGVEHSNICPPGHLNYFSPNTLCNLLTRVGYEVVEFDTPGKLDVDNMRSHFMHNKQLTSGNKMLDKIIASSGPESEVLAKALQDIVEKSQSSGHLRVIAMKKKTRYE